MSRWICIDDICIPSDENDWEELVAFADAIAEQEPIDIVRCRECKNSYTVDFTNTPARVIKRFCRIRRNALTGSFTVQDDDFCSYGVRADQKE